MIALDRASARSRARLRSRAGSGRVAAAPGPGGRRAPAPLQPRAPRPPRLAALLRPLPPALAALVALVALAALPVASAQDAPPAGTPIEAPDETPAAAEGAAPGGGGTDATAPAVEEGGDAAVDAAQEDAAARAADAAVIAWSEAPAAGVASLAGRPAAEVCAALPGLIASPPPPEGTRVNLEDRVERPAPAEGQRRFTYSASLPSGRPEVVQVDVAQGEDGAWTAVRTGLRPPGTSGRPWLQTPLASLVFLAVTAAVLLGLSRPSPLRRALAAGRATVREHRRIVAGTIVALYALFGLGAFTGAQLPDACADAAIAVVTDAVTRVGAAEAYGSGNVLRAATVTFYQNFVQVTVVLLFGLSLLLGVPAYLLGGASFFAQAIPFGAVGASGAGLLFLLLLLLLELTAYFLVISGGGVLIATVARHGLASYGDGVRKAASLLPWAGLLLLVGAWYEPAALLLFGG